MSGDFSKQIQNSNANPNYQIVCQMINNVDGPFRCHLELNNQNSENQNNQEYYTNVLMYFLVGIVCFLGVAILCYSESKYRAFEKNLSHKKNDDNQMEIYCINDEKQYSEKFGKLEIKSTENQNFNINNKI